MFVRRLGRSGGKAAVAALWVIMGAGALCQLPVFKGKSYYGLIHRSFVDIISPFAVWNSSLLIVTQRAMFQKVQRVRRNASDSFIDVAHDRRILDYLPVGVTDCRATSAEGCESDRCLFRVSPSQLLDLAVNHKARRFGCNFPAVSACIRLLTDWVWPTNPRCLSFQCGRGFASRRSPRQGTFDPVCWSRAATPIYQQIGSDPLMDRCSPTVVPGSATLRTPAKASSTVAAY